MTSLDDYIDAAIHQRWSWGTMDCCAFAGGWVVAATERDPFSAFRGLYKDSAKARRLVLRAGGLLPLVSTAMRESGFEQVTDFQHGDIAVIDMPGAQEEYRVAGAAVLIRHSNLWIARAINGIAGMALGPSQVAAAWRVLP